MKKIVSIAILSVALVACVATSKYQVRSASRHASQLEVRDGQTILTAAKPTSTVRVLMPSGAQASDEPLRVFVQIKNDAAAKITVLPEQMSLLIGSIEIRPLNWEQAAVERTRELDRRALASDLAAAFTAGQRSGGSQSQTITATALTQQSGPGVHTTTITANANDPVAREFSLRDSENDSKQIGESLRSEIGRIKAQVQSTAFKGQTLASGQSYGGVLYFTIPSDAAGKAFELVIRAGGDEHRLSFEQLPM